MTTNELSARYRNLLIVLTRMRSDLMQECQSLRDAAKLEDHTGRRAGLYCQAKVLARHAERLTIILRRNNAALRHFFQTPNLEKVAGQEIKVSNGKPFLTKNAQQIIC